MNRFPESVRRAMRETGMAATCVAVQLDAGDWESVFFVQMGGQESARDRQAVTAAKASVPVGLESDIIEHERAAVVVLRLEVHAVADDPMAVEILLTPGGASGHFDVLKRLTRQARLCWFFGDDDYRIIRAQQHALVDEQRADFDRLLLDAVKHDAIVRCTGRYDAQAALASIVSHYDLRADPAAHSA